MSALHQLIEAYSQQVCEDRQPTQPPAKPDHDSIVYKTAMKMKFEQDSIQRAQKINSSNLASYSGDRTCG